MTWKYTEISYVVGEILWTSFSSGHPHSARDYNWGPDKCLGDPSRIWDIQDNYATRVTWIRVYIIPMQ